MVTIGIVVFVGLSLVSAVCIYTVGSGGAPATHGHGHGGHGH